MAIVQDASSGALIHSTGTTAKTTGSFTPPNNSLIIVCSGVGAGSSSTNTTVKSSNDNTNWTNKLNQVGSGGDFAYGCSTISWRYFTTSPGSITVTVTPSGATSGTVTYGYVIVLTGVDSTTPVNTPGTSAVKTGTAYTNAITLSTLGSMVYGIAQDNANGGSGGGTWTAAANTTELDEYNGSGNGTLASFRSSAATVSTGAATFGETKSSPSGYGSIAMIEVLPDTGSGGGNILTTNLIVQNQSMVRASFW